MSQSASVLDGSPVQTEQQALSGRAQLLALLTIAVVVRALCWSTRPPDFSIFLKPWMNHIIHYGPVQAFAHPFSNYEPAYLYLLALGSLAHDVLATITIVKILSVAGTIFLTFALGDVLKATGEDRRSALLLLIMPSVAINDALLGQCDALWAGCSIFALAAMIRGRTLRAMIWCGAAIAFKAQAAFMAPVIIGAMIGRRAPWWQWAIPALVFLATLIPPWVLGWPAIKLLTVYVSQASFDQICGRLSNPWMIATIYGEQTGRQLFFLGYGAAAAAAVGIAALAAKNCRDPRILILLAAFAGTAVPFLLPKMLERYYFLGDVMTLALALTWKNRSAVFAAASVQMASVLAHLTYIYFFYDPYPALVGAICAAAGLVVMWRLAAPSFNSMVAEVPLPALRRRSSCAVPPRPASDGRTIA